MPKLAEKQKKFIELMTDESNKETFFNPMACYEKAGYKLARSPSLNFQAIGRLVTSRNVSTVLSRQAKKRETIAIAQHHYSSMWLWNQLLELLNACKEKNDLTNWGATLYKMGLIHAAWVQKLVIQPERMDELNERIKVEAREIARLRLNGMKQDIVDGQGRPLESAQIDLNRDSIPQEGSGEEIELQPDSEVDVLDCTGNNDLTCPDIGTQGLVDESAITADERTEDCKCIDNKDLQL